MKKVRKAVIPAAGFGTRMLPATKAIPKEMLPIVDKPAIQYIVEEAFASGIEDILIITSRGKSAIEDHFDRDFLLEAALSKPGKEDLLESVLYPTRLGNITFVRQPEQKGLGHAVDFAKTFVGDEPFAVLYGDDVIMSDDPVTAQLIRAYEKYGKMALGIKEVSDELIVKYSSHKVPPLEDNVFSGTDMVEKPAFEDRFSNYSILGRVLLTPDIFEILENQPAGAGGEIQLTDAMCTLARRSGAVGVDFYGKRYDMGNKLEMVKAIVETAMTHEEIGEDFKAYLSCLNL